MNRLLVSNGAQAQHERSVLLRNDGRGGFDEVSGTVGLDVDQDGRSFAVSDHDLDGDPDLVLMSPRSSPQLRVLRNDYAEKGAALALRLTGTRSNRDAAGARVTVETDRLRRTKILQVGSGFMSQHSKELLIGLGQSDRIVRVTVVWPSGLTQALSGLSPGHRVWIEEGREPLRSEPFRSPRVPVSTVPPRPPELRSSGTWLYEPIPAPPFALAGLDGLEHSLAALSGRPALVVFWATWAPPSQVALEELARQRRALAATGTSVLALSVDNTEDEPKVRAAIQGLGLPVMMAGEEVAGTYAILHRYLFDRREDLRLPAAFLISGQGAIVKVYRDRIVPSQILEDVPKIEASAAERLARAVPFAGTFHSRPGQRSDFQYGLELSEHGFDASALAAFERVAKVDPSALAFYNLGTLYMKGGAPTSARAAYERALELQPGYADASNSLGALLAQSGEVPAAIERFRAAIRARPDFADALNNLGFALFQTGEPAQAYELYQKALALKPDFPEALNNVGIYFGRQGDLEAAQRFFQQALEKRAGYDEAANNLALVLAARGDHAGAIAVLRRALELSPEFETTYATLARLLAQAGQREEALRALERLLQRNPSHPLGQKLLRELNSPRVP
jgi:Tfp pilus assembly protein PilF/peroxiredoxin